MDVNDTVVCIKNEGTATILPHGAIEFVRYDSDRTIVVRQSRASGTQNEDYFANGPMSVPQNEMSIICLSWPRWIRGASTLTPGATVNPTPGSQSFTSSSASLKNFYVLANTGTSTVFTLFMPALRGPIR